MMYLYGLPERHMTIVKRCDMKLDAVPLSAPMRTLAHVGWWIKLLMDRVTGPRWRPGEVGRAQSPPQHPCGRDSGPNEGSTGRQSTRG